MTSALAKLGIAGAVVILLGAGVAGSGFVIDTLVEQNEISCQYSDTSSCGQNAQTNANNTVIAEFLISGGFLAGGIGLFLVLFAMVAIMARRDAGLPPSPASPPPAGVPPPAPPPETPPAPTGPPPSWSPPPTWDSRPPGSS